MLMSARASGFYFFLPFLCIEVVLWLDDIVKESIRVEGRMNLSLPRYLQVLGIVMPCNFLTKVSSLFIAVEPHNC